MTSNRRNFLGALLSAAALPLVNPSSEKGTSSGSIAARDLAVDPLRPQYHFLPAANWTNDPNGPIYWNGEYHMFHQYNPNGAYWGDMHWGHAASSDMVHWRHLPVALAPTPGGPDADGCFSGTAVVQDDRVVLVYTGVHAATAQDATIKDKPMLRETQCLAVAADPQLIRWIKMATPVIGAPPNNLDVNGFRDPSPWRQGNWWYTVLGSGLAGQGGAVLLYRSRDLRNWEFLHVFSKRDEVGASHLDPFDPWEVWECPEFFALGDRHVLMFSVAGRVHWQSGHLDPSTMIFHPQQVRIADYGTFYAAKTQLDRSGNRILWGWINETRQLAEYKAAGWAGMISLPRVLELSPSGRLRFRVADEVHQLRAHAYDIALPRPDDQVRRQIDSVHLPQCCAEVLCTVKRGTDYCSLVFGGAGIENFPWLTISYDPRHREYIRVDAHAVPMDLNETEDVEIHVYFDGSVAELFLNGQAAWVKRFYYAGATPQDLRLHWDGPTLGLTGLSASGMKPISSDRLTT